jgi:hypothetical protein
VWHVLAPIFLAPVLAPLSLAAYLALAAFVDGKPVGQNQTAPTIRFPRAIALPVFVAEG